MSRVAFHNKGEVFDTQSDLLSGVHIFYLDVAEGYGRVSEIPRFSKGGGIEEPLIDVLGG